MSLSTTYCTTREAAQILGLSQDSVKKYCQWGRIKAENVGRQWLIRRAEVRKYAENTRKYARS